VTSPLEAPAVLHPLAALSVSKTMWTTSQKARLTVRQAAAVGKGTSRPVQETTMAPSHGEIVHSHQDKGPLVLSRRVGIWMDASTVWSKISAATVREPVDARARRPTFLSPGPGKANNWRPVIR